MDEELNIVIASPTRRVGRSNLNEVAICCKQVAGRIDPERSEGSWRSFALLRINSNKELLPATPVVIEIASAAFGGLAMTS